MNPARILHPKCQKFLVVIKISTQGTIKGPRYSWYDRRNFLEDGDKYYNEFEYGQPLVTKQAHTKLSWYYLAYVCGLQFIKGYVTEAVF
jgi:hypothetical protein